MARREGGQPRYRAPEEAPATGIPRHRAARAGLGAGGGKGRVTVAAAPVNWGLIALNGDPGRSGAGLQMNENTAKKLPPS